jgi:hypothetical protein
VTLAGPLNRAGAMVVARACRLVVGALVEAPALDPAIFRIVGPGRRQRVV